MLDAHWTDPWERDSELLSESYDPVVVASYIVRRFACTGRKLANPALGFNREFTESCDANGRLEPTSYLGDISAARFSYEKDHAEMVANLIWERKPSLAAKDVLLRLFVADAVVDGASGLGWNDCPAIRGFVESACYVHGHRAFSRDTQTEEIMANTKGLEATVLRDCREMFGESATIVNPLVALRERDATGRPSFAGVAERARAVGELEGLSRRVWEFKTCTDMGHLVTQLMLEADGGMADLALIDSYAELIGAKHRAVREGAGNEKGLSLPVPER